MTKRVILLSVVLYLLSVNLLQAQKSMPAVEGWRVHASFRTNNDIAEVGNTIYVGSLTASFTFNEETNETEILSKTNGFSDVGVKQLEYDKTTGTLVFGYDNMNIDLLQNGKIYNIPEVASQVIMGNKSLYNIAFYNRSAYISCGFGIAVIDIDQKRLTDSYMNLGYNGSSIPVYDVAFYDNYIYAVSDSGIYRANLSSANLSDFHSWSLFKTSVYSRHVETFNNYLFAEVDSTLYRFNGTAWNVFPGQVSQQITDIKSNNNRLTVVYFQSCIVIDQNDQVETSTLIKGATTALMGSNGNLFAIIPDQFLLEHPLGTNQIDYFGPSGPYGSTAIKMAYSNQNLWVAGGQLDGFLTTKGWGPTFTPNKFYRFNHNDWYNYNNYQNAVVQSPWDIIDVAIHPQTQHAFFASFGAGVLEMTQNATVAVYDTSNSSLQRIAAGTPAYNPLCVSGIDFDAQNNMWVSNFGAANPVSVRTAQGQWYAFSLPQSIDRSLGYITCDDYGNKWIIHTKGLGLVVFNENGTYGYLQDDRMKVLTNVKQNGALPSNTVFCVTKEQKGELWVGTASGLCIFRNPGDIFKANADFDAQQIVIKTGLVYSNFLGNEPIYCITVDAANRKWIGTAHGAWLVSADGYTVIKNFTMENSPLPGEAIYEISINDETGEVFFSTEKGIVSYMGTATDGSGGFGDVLVYPNPVRPDYTGLIVIRGLAENVNVKITDIAGNLVYETRSNGGMATWNGLNFAGRRAATGVYLVFSATDDGTESNVSKILFIN